MLLGGSGKGDEEDQKKLLDVEASPECSESPLRWPLVTDAEWKAFEGNAKKPTLYEPPQKNGNGCFSSLLCIQRVPCCYVVRECSMCACQRLWPLRRFKLSVPDEVFTQMLSVSHPNCPEHFKGVWWLEDNVASEGLLTFQDGDWHSERIMVKKNWYNWTYGADTIGGLFLTANAMWGGGMHQFQLSPSGDWINIHIRWGRDHFIYVLKEGDVLKRPDGTEVEFTPGEDMMRISFEAFDSNSPVFYQYMVRRVAYLDSEKKLVKTNNYDRLMEVAANSASTSCSVSTCCKQTDPAFRHILDNQVVAISSPALQGWSCTAEKKDDPAPPQQAVMSH